MTSAATMAPGRGIGGLGGWLSMAPQTDDAPTKRETAGSAVMDTELSAQEALRSDKGQGESTVQQAPTSASDTQQARQKPPYATEKAQNLLLSSQGATDMTDTMTTLASPRIHSPLVPNDARYVNAPAQSSRQPPLNLKPKASNTFNGKTSERATSDHVAPRHILPRTNARFSVGFDSSCPPTPSSLAPSSPRSGDGDDSPPPFDVRASFAPMPAYGETVTSTARRRQSEPGHDTNIDGMQTSGKRLMQDGAKVSYVLETKEDDGEHEGRLRTVKGGLLGKFTDPVHLHDEEGDLSAGLRSPEEVEQEIAEDDDDDGHRVHVAGRKWKGKTANAIELEMEALGDHTVMSYAPDAVYLASRLEGLRRNLEAGGERIRRPAWLDEEEEAELVRNEEPKVERDDGTSQGPTSRLQAPSPGSSKALYRRVSDSPVPAIGVPASDLNSQHEETTTEAMDVDKESRDEAVQVQGNDDVGKDSAAADTARVIAPAAKEAALDARVEIRTLRRPDLEQVRELHCYHGNGDKFDADTYTTSAAFLLRLLVDEHYVCLVAVAKPLPEPEALPTQFVPYCPPPSLDMPPAQSPFLMAGRNTTPRRDPAHTPAGRMGSRLGPHPHISALVNGARAPRSFGAGPDSETASSSTGGTSDEERRRQSSLFDMAKAASTHITGDTSSPENEVALSDNDDDDEEMEDGAATRSAAMPVLAEEDEASGIQHSRTTSQSTLQQVAIKRASMSSRQPRTVLAGPTFDVAPPRAIRVMGAPPPSGVPAESETILGVAAARIKVVQRAEDEWGSGSGLYGPSDSTAKDSSWPGMDPRGEAKTVVTREAHVLSLSVLPGERGQGLGARLLDRMLDECRRRTAGPRIKMAPGSTIKEEDVIVDGNSDAPMSSAPPRAHQDAPMRTVLEVHPSNKSAMNLYTNRGFQQIPGNRGIVRHFFRGDQRIPASIRLQVGGSDAVRLERREKVT